MNKRARNRLIAVTAVILAAVASVLVFVFMFSGAQSRTVGEVVDDTDLVGERVRVSGTVVAGSWDKATNPMTFDIREEGTDDGPTIGIVYRGSPPATFGDGVVAVVTGEVTEDGIIDSADMITKCPSKYESQADAMSVASLISIKDTMVGNPTKISGEVAAGTIAPPGGVRFTLAGEGEDLDVVYDGALPDGMSDGTVVVVQGSLEEDGTFAATSVAIAED